MPANAEAWAKLTAPVPESVLKPLDAAAAGGLTGMSDIPEWYIYDRLRESGLPWSETLEKGELLAQVGNAFYYCCTVRLTIDGQVFDGIGAHDHAKLEWAVKGAHTSAFKDAAKWAGITMSVWKSGDAPRSNGSAAAVRTAPPTAVPSPTAGAINYGTCPTHRTSLIQRAGISKTTGKPYDMVVCTERGCNFILSTPDRNRIEAAHFARPA